ncbi:MAG: DUF1015 domain-containing protein [Oscillospiraceae bacterium]|nr:DUF1015 domain-containing protein [Oscillospiraceae bacterium]
MQNIFTAADILLPDFTVTDAAKWSVIACDQFTGDPSYWENAAALVGDAPSTLSLILPEVYLEDADVEERICAIRTNMEQYLENGVLRTYEDAMIYVERMQGNGVLRAGVIGKIDLEAYDYNKGSVSPVRATEATVLERIPPRMRVREKAELELPHIMILIDDPQDTAIGSCTAAKNNMQKLYSTELMSGGGSVDGYLMGEAEQAAFQSALSALLEREENRELQFAMGDGNHSLATAKACYEAMKQANPGVDLSDHPARYALVEIVNLHSDALQFEAIHRIIENTDTAKLIDVLTQELALSETESEQPVTVVQNGTRRTLYIHKPSSNLAVGSLQNVLDAFLAENAGKIDYIHGEETVERLAAKDGSIGFLLPDLHKSLLFPSVQKDGVLPRKTFSMGHAEDKRYYMECRRIR